MSLPRNLPPGYRMTLGNQPPFCGRGKREHAPYDCERHGLYVHKPFARLFERINNRKRYRPGPKPWAPGRYATACWYPYFGYGRFSGVREMLRGQYHAERYTGDRRRPSDYLLTHGGPEEHRRHIEQHWRRSSWRMAA